MEELDAEEGGTLIALRKNVSSALMYENRGLDDLEKYVDG
jgi:hypothetical protein